MIFTLKGAKYRVHVCQCGCGAPYVMGIAGESARLPWTIVLPAMMPLNAKTG